MNERFVDDVDLSVDDGERNRDWVLGLKLRPITKMRSKRWSLRAEVDWCDNMNRSRAGK